MEAAIGVDRQLTKTMTGNVTYVFSQGVHQYFTDNLSAAAADIRPRLLRRRVSFEPRDAEPDNERSAVPVGRLLQRAPADGDDPRDVTGPFSFFTNYTYSNANGDTSGVGSVPSVSSFPGLDYGRHHASTLRIASWSSATSCCRGRFPSRRWWWRIPARLQRHDRARI